MNHDSKKYIKKRNKAVYSLDVETFKHFLREENLYIPDYPDWFWMGTMAKVIMNITDSPNDKRDWARGVLSTLGWSEKLNLY